MTNLNFKHSATYNELNNHDNAQQKINPESPFLHYSKIFIFPLV